MPKGIYNRKLSKPRFPHSEETKRKIGIANKVALKGRIPKSAWKKGQPSPKGMLGKYHSEETKKKMSEAHKGEKSSNWKGGITTYKRKLFLNSCYRARKRKTVGFYTWNEWELLKKQYGYCCLVCKKCEPEITLTPDHIIPLSKGGSNYIENIQPLCRSCNCRKYTKIINYKNVE